MNIQLLKHKIDFGAPLTRKDLEDACYIGDLEVVKLILENSTYIDMGIHTIWIASLYGHEEIVKLLLEAEASIELAASSKK